MSVSGRTYIADPRGLIPKDAVLALMIRRLLGSIVQDLASIRFPKNTDDDAQFMSSVLRMTKEAITDDLTFA